MHLRVNKLNLDIFNHATRGNSPPGSYRHPPGKGNYSSSRQQFKIYSPSERGGGDYDSVLIATFVFQFLETMVTETLVKLGFLSSAVRLVSLSTEPSNSTIPHIHSETSFPLPIINVVCKYLRQFLGTSFGVATLPICCNIE